MKLGIALGAGGAKGFAHIGILKTLHKAGIDFDIVTGTSIGALIGGVYAGGDIKRFEEAIKKINSRDIFFLLSPTWPKYGFFSGKRLLKKLKEFIHVENIEELNKRFGAVCVDLNSSEAVTITTGNIFQAIRASISIPVIFTPITVDGRVLVDGGVLDPVPVKAAYLLGSDFTVAVDLIGQREETDSIYNNLVSNVYIPNILDMVYRISITTQRYMIKSTLKENHPDVLIRPDLSSIKFFDFHRAEQAIKIGEEAAKEALPDIESKLKAKANPTQPGV
ncbi:putative NTE family protein [bacterium HR37]|nr:putative NTE family protein [bacterium HR37]